MEDGNCVIWFICLPPNCGWWSNLVIFINEESARYSAAVFIDYQQHITNLPPCINLKPTLL